MCYYMVYVKYGNTNSYKYYTYSTHQKAVDALKSAGFIFDESLIVNPWVRGNDRADLNTVDIDDCEIL